MGTVHTETPTLELELLLAGPKCMLSFVRIKLPVYLKNIETTAGTYIHVYCLYM
jgi:hypothetical protein